ncbi:MAG: hypothetical protein B5M54_06665 [Candidatus Aminicenantes bacterium 4484_214]|nr:MAG: hypothetical protein B5M54_06665 [Candidatus Aminicenantes bacterium 4484_214]RLE04997.1 MAG: hypothetical protein DRJ06_09570 [Candidatus Aminicenantes bacterium]
MKKVISASRRTDLVAFFPDWVEKVLKVREARVWGPSSHVYKVSLEPDKVHTIVLWSKDFSNILQNKYNLFSLFREYDQLYCHFTITGLGATVVEPHVIPPHKALEQLEPLAEWVQSPQRISLRFDPIVFWKEGSQLKTNLYYFEKIAPYLQKLGVKSVKFSFVQWYQKARRRAAKRGFCFFDPPPEKKIEAAQYLMEVARQFSLELTACCQPLIVESLPIKPAACIDGAFLEKIHPQKLPVSKKKDRTQRQHCHCTDSVDIGSYIQHCPHACVYCYANPLE